MSNPAHEHIEFECIDHDQPQDERCGATVSYPEQYVTIERPRDEAYEHMERALKFRCSECGAVHHRCPVCTTDDATPAGWYEGESTGKQLACHLCNEQEYAAQQQDPYR